jgi:hypothetical protein
MPRGDLAGARSDEACKCAARLHSSKRPDGRHGDDARWPLPEQVSARARLHVAEASRDALRWARARIWARARMTSPDLPPRAPVSYVFARSLLLGMPGIGHSSVPAVVLVRSSTILRVPTGSRIHFV